MFPWARGKMFPIPAIIPQNGENCNDSRFKSGSGAIWERSERIDTERFERIDRSLVIEGPRCYNRKNYSFQERPAERPCSLQKCAGTREYQLRGWIMKKLTELLNGIDYKVLLGSEDVEISGIVNDSRKVKAGSLFLCIRGAVADGHKYAAEVAKKGAKVLVVEEPVELPDPEKDSITVLQVPRKRARRCLWWRSRWSFRIRRRIPLRCFRSLTRASPWRALPAPGTIIRPGR